MRVRVRPAYTPDDLPGVYPRPHQHSGYADHEVRVKRTIALAGKLYPPPRGVVVDLACGDAAIPRALGAETLILGDYAAGYPVQGMIEDTIKSIAHADLFIFTEIMEHLDDPDAMLAEIRSRADRLVLSTPVAEAEVPGRDVHDEHYWSWDTDDVKLMLYFAGWHPVLYDLVGFIPAIPAFQIWGCQ